MWLDRLREMKAERGLTTKEIAEQSGVPEPTLEKLFAGATKDPKLKTMRQLVHFFGYTLDDLEGDALGVPLSPLPAAEPDADPLRAALLENFDQLNQEGRELLVDQSDTMVSSGKYLLKNLQNGMDSKEA